ncbi:ATP-binding protein [Rhodoflexus sp.]
MALLRTLLLILLLQGLILSLTAQNEVLLHGKVVFDDGRPAANVEFQIDNLRKFYTDRKGQFGSMVPASFAPPDKIQFTDHAYETTTWSYDAEQRFLQINIRTVQHMQLTGRVVTRSGEPIANALITLTINGSETPSQPSDANGYFLIAVTGQTKLSAQPLVKVNGAPVMPKDVSITETKQGYFLRIYDEPSSATTYAVIVYNNQKQIEVDARIIYNKQEFMADNKGVIYIPLSTIQDMQRLKVVGATVTARKLSTPLRRISLYTAPIAAPRPMDSSQIYIQLFDEVTRIMESNKSKIENYNSLVIGEINSLSRRFSNDANIHPVEARRYMQRMEALEQLLLTNHHLISNGNEQTHRALLRLKEAIAAKDSLARMANVQVANLERINAELDRANKRIENDARNQLMVAAALIVTFLSMSMAIGYYYRRTVRQKQELEATNAELTTTLTTLKKTQAQLVQQDRMTSLGQMAAGIAHEINNPINFIYAGADSLRRNFADLKQLLTIYGNPVLHNGSRQKAIEEWESMHHNAEVLIEESDELVASLKRGATRTFEIVQGLRTFARIDEENLIKMVDIEVGLSNVLMLMSGQLPPNIRIETRYAGVPKIECYPARLNQVFLNLLVNAIEAVDDRGVITVSTHYPARNVCPNTPLYEAVAITIADTGRGISQKNLQHIFDPFFTTKEIGDGRGLGLSIALSIVKEHGGNIIAQSQEGKGSQFIIILPCQLNQT